MYRYVYYTIYTYLEDRYLLDTTDFISLIATAGLHSWPALFHRSRRVHSLCTDIFIEWELLWDKPPCEAAGVTNAT